ncbi:Protein DETOXIFICATION 44, chloroplastic [Coccomyxa sp. Obi]|nr:Protein DETOXIFICATION 44, chloroplastic [Coccomyxa sp. Obi]
MVELQIGFVEDTREDAEHACKDEESSFPRKSVDTAIASLALPALATLAADPLASLIDIAYLGHLGSLQLASVGVALSIFGTITKLLNIPLLSVTTNVVATAVGSDADDKDAQIGLAASTSLLIAILVSIAEGGALVALGANGLSLWGVQPGSPLRGDALDFLQIKALGAPATLLLMVSQGVYRGLGDTKMPLWATVGCNLINILLDPLLIFGLGWGVRGAAIATVAAEGAAAAWLIASLGRKYSLSLAGRSAMASLPSFLGPTGLLALRTVAISGTFALATSLAARSDLAHAAAHQICIQLWLASSLLADSLAVAAQTLLAQGLAANELGQVRKIAERTLQFGVGLGLSLGTLLAVTSGVLPPFFTSDPAVIAAIGNIFPFVILSQPINALAFVWDGVLYGAGGFEYAAKAMAVCATPAVGCMLLALLAPGAPDLELGAVWLGLTVLMTMRSITIYIPWKLQRTPFDKIFRKAVKTL